MLQRIDHAVIVVRDLANATRDYEALGFTVTPGGVYADGGAENALIAFADGSYLELLALTGATRPPASARPRRDAEEGLDDLAVLSDDLDADLARLRPVRERFHLQTDPVVEAGWRRPDGQEVRWRQARFIRQVGDALPFVMQDVTPHALRVPKGEATRHRLPVTGIAGVTVGLRELAVHGERYAYLIGRDLQVSVDALRMRIPLGEQWFDLVTPDFPVEGVAALLEQRGEGPVALTLRGERELDEQSVEALDPQVTHGALIVVPTR